jgi:hypothetical protein
MTMKLRLGPIPKTEKVKVTITLSARLKMDLDRYAELHAQTWGEAVETTTLIPYMLETFIARDRGFRKARDDSRSQGTASRARACYHSLRAQRASRQPRE